MFTINHRKPSIRGNEEEISIRGEKLNNKLSIHKRSSGYFATASGHNDDLIKFLDTLPYLSNKTLKSDKYYWWELDHQKVIQLMNDVMRNFE